MTDDPTNYRKYRLVDDLELVTSEEFDRLTEEQVTLFLARAGISPLDTAASLKRAKAMLAKYVDEEEWARRLR